MLVLARKFLLFLFQGGLFWNVLGVLIFASLSFSHDIPFPLTILLNRFSIYQNFHCQNKFYWALGLDYMVFLSCNDKGEKSLDLKTGVYRWALQTNLPWAPPTNLILSSKKLIVSFEYSAVNFIVGWKVFNLLRNFSRDYAPCSQIKKNVVYVPPPYHRFLLKGI